MNISYRDFIRRKGNKMDNDDVDEMVFDVSNHKLFLNKMSDCLNSIIKEFSDNSFSSIPVKFTSSYSKYFRDIYRYTHVDELGNERSDVIGGILMTYIHTDSFFRNESNITNSKLFWILQFFPYTLSTADYTEYTFDDWMGVFKKFDRLDVPLEKRQELSSSNLQIVSRKNPKKVNQLIWDYIKKFKPDDDVIMYRGFTVAKDEDVRKGRFKIGNPDSGKQAEGVGFSYSIDNKTAGWFSNRLLISDDKKHFKRGVSVTNKDGKKVGVKYHDVKLPTTFVNKLKPELVDKTARRVVGKFSVKRKDILYWNNSMKVLELVCLPETTTLISYKLSQHKTIVHTVMDDDKMGFEYSDLGFSNNNVVVTTKDMFDEESNEVEIEGTADMKKCFGLS
jgi:hypothetical protein